MQPRAVLRAPFTRRAWFEAAYCLAAFPLAVLGFVVTLVPLALGAALTATLVGAVLGLVLLVGVLVLARLSASLHRGLAARLLGERTAPPPPFRRGQGIGGRIDARLRDVTAWRAIGYVLARLPVAALGAYGVAWWITALLNLTLPLRWVFGGRTAGGIPMLTPLPAGGTPHISTWPGTLVSVAAGAATLLAAPWLVRAAVAADRRLRHALLGPGELTQRVRALEETRALAVDDATARLRRLERDLHDGPQVRLVAVALSLDMAREKLADQDGPISDPDGVRRLVATAHRSAAETLSELRDLSRGLHPPALDEGLPDALATLAARSALPVELSAEVPVRPTQAIETMAYYCVAELLANAAKHSGARRAVVTVTQRDDALRLRVTDDGSGGARVLAGGGLAGLHQRIRTVDGRLHISSPEGGPTAITVVLPPHA
ncbi:histidine kinase [Streptomyces lincolnensis]|uniref:histidine kinase n=1 Tax=Streptomyces lincolnensis TaxID=1915 RepID=A0A1B1MPI1_STRLN|nr:sensor histidine kinase [Streptomyces lincolnensis]ANS70463.1 histidine kinase [Streptomyces lincolnensis]